MANKPIEYFKKDDNIMAILARPKLINDSLKFLTPKEFPLQLGIHNRENGSKIDAHLHLPFSKLEDLQVQEVFYVLQGEMEVSLFDNAGELFKKIPLKEGEILLINCPHGILFKKACKFFEIKQGPYRGNEKEKKLI